MGSPSDIDSDSNPPSPLSPDDLYTSGKRQRFVESGRGSGWRIVAFRNIFIGVQLQKMVVVYMKFDCGKGQANSEIT